MQMIWYKTEDRKDKYLYVGKIFEGRVFDNNKQVKHSGYSMDDVIRIRVYKHSVLELNESDSTIGFITKEDHNKSTIMRVKGGVNENAQ